MFTNGELTIQYAAEQIQIAEDAISFKHAIYDLKKCLIELGADSENLMQIEQRAYYLPNSYSEMDTKDKIEQAKKRVLEYINEKMDVSLEDKRLLSILENFYLFMEGLLEREPHKKGGIQKEQLETLIIRNEYDVQHLLFAYIRPLYPTARAEVSEDTGYNTVRVDIALDAKKSDRGQVYQKRNGTKETYRRNRSRHGSLQCGMYLFFHL